MSRLTAIVPQQPQTKQASRLTVAPGVACYRSANLTEKKAKAFAACLQGNKNFADATVHATRPGSALFYVAYLPANPERQADVLARYQQEQIDRAASEMDGYLYFVSPHRPHLVSVTSLPDEKTQYRNTYEVNRIEHTCTCPHFKNRLAPVGALCKHLVAVFATDPQPARPRTASERMADFS